MDTADGRLSQHDTAIGALNEAVLVLHDAVSRVATKEDLAALSSTISGQHSQELKDAHNSVPSKVAIAFSVGLLLLAILGVVFAHHA